MASNSPDYKALFLREAELRRQAEERTRQTTFRELIQLCHNLFSRSLRVEDPRLSTTGKIPPPTGKRCPLRLLPWTDCAARQQEVYHSVCNYLEPPREAAERLFPPRLVLEGFGQEFSKRAISSEQDLESFERFGVENHVRDIIAELCTKSAARDEFHLGDGIWFDNHANALDPVDVDTSQATEPSTSRRSRPDQFCIRRVDGETRTLLTTVEYKPPHKLSVKKLRAGLRPMDFWDEVVRPNFVPTEEPEKLRYNAARLTGSAVVQEFHVMIQEGLEYSYLTNGLALVLLRVPYDDPTTLYYHLCEPNMEIDPDDDRGFEQPMTAVARVLCLCLMSFRSRFRGQEWRNNALARLPEWTTSFAHIRSEIPQTELQRDPPDSEYTPSVSARTVSEYLPSSSPVESPTEGRRVPTRSGARCAPANTTRDGSPHSDTDQAPGRRKRCFSQITSSPSSPSVQRSARQAGSRDVQSGQSQQHSARFCTQRCLLGLQQGGLLDDHCPNVKLHRRGSNSNRHPINAEGLVQRIKQQLDKNIDDCTPMGGCGASGAPFKITCAAYGYTVVGKGTTSRLWNEVSREADIYRILSQVQGSAVPVFLGAIDLAKIYFLDRAGAIRHMLLMAWGGEPISKIQHDEAIRHEISRSKEKIYSLGVLHQDLRPDNILWNAELGRALIIDFHRSELDSRPTKKRMRPREQLSCAAEEHWRKRRRAVYK